MTAPALQAQLTDIPADWPATVREIVRRDGQPVRAGAGNSIQVKSLTTNQWLTLQLPNGAKHFAHEADRDAILGQIVGENNLLSDAAKGPRNNCDEPTHSL